MENPSVASNAIPLKFDDHPNRLYILKLLPARKNMAAFSKFTSLILPVFSAGYESMQDYKNQVSALALELEEGEDAITDSPLPQANTLDASLILAEQLKKPEFAEVADLLLEGLYHAVEQGGSVKEVGQVDLDNEFFGEDFEIYLRILETAVRRNFATPLVL